MASRPDGQPRSPTLRLPRATRRLRWGPLGTPFTMTVHAPAKLNLFLEVLGKRADGYHEIVTCMVALELCDSLKFTPARDLFLTCDEPSLTTGPDNLILKAARLLQWRTGCPQGAAIHLTKRIPIEAGLGGGSSDAAAALRGLNELWDLHLPTSDLQELAAELGSDVPFFVAAAGAAWCTGRGERIETIAALPELAFVLFCPGRGIRTAEVYRRLSVPAEPRAPDAMRAALASGAAPAIGRALFNRLEEAAWPLCPALPAIRRLVDQFDAAQPILGHQMSGSGSAYFALCPNLAEAHALAAAVRSAGESPPGQDDPGFSLLVVRSRRCGA
jgi:4-diphosphocytidyl-2-C-methyl-D-erythritol kinase